MRQNNGGLTSDQRWTAAGLLGVIAAVSLGKNALPTPVVIATSIGYGIGSSAAVGLYRTADLLKNGEAEHNVFGKGLMAGLAVAFGMTAIQTIPDIIAGDYLNGISNTAAVISGVVGIAAGFIQSRSSFATETVAAAQEAVGAER